MSNDFGGPAFVVEERRGPDALPGSAFDLVIEVPHGATATADFEAVAGRLRSPLPDGLVDFFHVNTDAGAPELALALAESFLARRPAASVAVLIARIPRTFLDFNRVATATPEELRKAGVGPGLMPWVTDPDDAAWLGALHREWEAAVLAAIARLNPDGHLVSMHTYAPRTLDVRVDLDIVRSLRDAWAPGRAETWPLRPPIDLIARAPDGTRVIPDALFDAVQRHLAPLGLAAGDSATYTMHPGTLGHLFASRLPGRALCPEVRRDLVVESWSPFEEAAIDLARVAPIAAAFAAALDDVMPGR
jgi:hypothetical protein